jgi:hypothetical protein
VLLADVKEEEEEEEELVLCLQLEAGSLLLWKAEQGTCLSLPLAHEESRVVTTPQALIICLPVQEAVEEEEAQAAAYWSSLSSSSINRLRLLLE